jgi:hypothetical protein
VAVQICLVVLLCLALLAVSPQFVGPPEPAFLLSLGLLAPWALALAMLFFPRRRRAALMLAGVASILALIPLVPVMGFWTLVGGLMHGNGQWLSYISAMAGTLLLMVIAVISIHGAWSMRRRSF